MPYLPIVLTRSQSDTDAIAILNAITSAGVTPTTPMVNAAHFFVTASKWAGLWTKFVAVYGLMGGTAASHAINWKTPGTYDIANKANAAWTGMTHNANGITGNGSSTYGDTGIIPSSVLSLNSAHCSFYRRSGASTSEYDFGCQDGTSNFLGVARPDGNTSVWLNSLSGDALSSTPRPGVGLSTCSRTGASSVSAYKNGTKFLKGTTASLALTTARSIYIAARNNIGTPSSFSDANYSFFSIGSGLTDIDAYNLFWIVQATQKILSRDV